MWKVWSADEGESVKPDPLYIWLAVLALWFGILGAVCLITPGHSVMLEESMNSSGQGYHSLEVLPDISNLNKEEAMVLLGPAYNFNVSKEGLITFKNGSTWSMVRCNETERTI